MDFPQIRISNSFLFTVASKFEIRSIYHVSAIKQIAGVQTGKGVSFQFGHLGKISSRSAGRDDSPQDGHAKAVTIATRGRAESIFPHHRPQRLYGRPLED